MKVLYPASHDIPQLPDAFLAVKIARHSRCTGCSSCPGLRPPPDVQVVLDSTHQSSSLSGLNVYGSDDDDGSASYLESCVCGHGVTDHGANESLIGRDEFARRGRVAVRLDELLEEADKLLDFDYSDEDTDSLRQQMQLRSSSPRSTLGTSGSSRYHVPALQPP
ncbi:hypothetical protein B0H21DRAFT_704962 [Amylocystis lapponica]|nr:hypothetical protein B0H21DRAFT_704962 [Amylocystis lapponica]